MNHLVTVGMIFDFFMTLFISGAGFYILYKEIQSSDLTVSEKAGLMAIGGIIWTLILGITWTSKIIIIYWIATK